MKHNRFLLLAVLFPVLGVQAQTSYEAATLLDSDLSGTARYVGMGGAMSALGADISTMATNPAGTALYRRWDAALSFGGNLVTQHTQTGSNHNRAFSSYGSFDNFGMVIATKKSNEDILRFVNFGFNARDVKRFDGKMGMASALDGLSQTIQMAEQAWQNVDFVNYTSFDPYSPNSLYNRNYYRNYNYGWLTLLGADADLMGIYVPADVDGNLQYDEDGNVVEDYWYRLANGCNYSERLSGGIDAFDFNLSFNLADAVYLGITLTTYDVDYRLESTYSESFSDGGYTLQNFYSTTGSGYDFKFGVILRPFVESSFRLGLSATTPTVYSLRDCNSAVIDSEFSYYDEGKDQMMTASFGMDTQSSDAFDGDCYTNYTMVAPAKYNISLGGTIGRSLALGAEYEYDNLGAIVLYDENGNANAPMNEHTAKYFTGRHTLRLGAEKTFGAFYTRLGYNFQAGGYGQDAWKMLLLNSVQTNTAYTNLKHTQNFTCGVGFRGDVFYADAALLYSTQKADFYPFDVLELQATSLSRNHVKGMMTLGMRF